MSALAGWESFYVIVGSAAGALIGLQFVVMALITQRSNATIDNDAGGVFSTPTIVHFSAVLLLSGVLTAPWRGVTPVAILWGLAGLTGTAYIIIIALRMRKQTTYKPYFEDWLFHALLPLAAYGTLAVSAFATRVYVRGAPFGVAAAALLLLFIGIHNAWDIVTYHVFVRKQE
jgi:hypothetical protein